MTAEDIAKRDKYGRFVKGTHPYPSTEFKVGKSSPRKGIKKPGFTNQTSFKPRRNLWETNVREYQAIHRWIKKEKGQPSFCEFCKRENLTPTQYHWANKSRKYLRNISDWIRLCHKCHQEWDHKYVSIERASTLIRQAAYAKKLIMIAGNGGSLSMSAHFAGELMGHFEKKNRPSVGAIALNNSTVMSAIANDFGQEYVFSKQIMALGEKNGLLILFTTSDSNRETRHSMNLIKAAIAAKDKRKMKVIVIGSEYTKRLKRYSNCFIQAVGTQTAEIQNDQLEIIHKICREFERKQ